MQLELFQFFVHYYSFHSVGADGDDLHRNTRLAFDELDIGLEFRGEVLVAGEGAQVAFPPRELAVDGFQVVADLIGEIRRTFAADLVFGGDADGLEICLLYTSDAADE